jgi:hypothetical protein
MSALARLLIQEDRMAPETERPGPVWDRQPGAETLASNLGMETACAREINTAGVPKKWERVLAALLDGRSFNRFDAERELSDHCLHSTVSYLQARGLTVHRREERVPGYRGILTRVMRYRLAEESRSLAAKLLGREAQHAPRPGL